MEKLRGVFVVVFLVVIVVLSVYSVWRDGSEEASVQGPETKEEWIERKLDDWVPLAP